MADGSPKESAPAGAARAIGYVFGLILAVIGLLNVLPAFGGLPRVGPFPAAQIHPALLGLGFVVSFAAVWAGAPKRRLPAPVVMLIDAVLAGAALYTLWRYFVDVSILENEGLFLFENSHAWIALTGCLITLVMCWRIWGAPLAIVGSIALAYFFTGQHWPGIFRTTVIDFAQDVPNELWFNTGDGVLGNLFGIVITTILPFILLGAMLEGTGGGHSLIKLSFYGMRRFRGGPAHAAILASSLFGTISGSAVANVVGTGVITIPMIKRRGFRPSFAGGVEATASTGGQIMPPIMGAAALVMADFTGIRYLTIIVAAIVPALAYYGSLFATVVFECRRLGVEAGGDDVEMDPVAPQDWLNAVLVVVPVGVVIGALIQGASPAGSAILALGVLAALSIVLNPAIRRRPWLLISALARGGQTFGRLLMAVATVGIIVAVLGATGLPTEFAKVVSAATGDFLLPTLIFAALASLALGMGMPTLPAYLTIIIILGPSIKALGLTDLGGHFFVFYYGVASAITPPVAIAAYAAAAISGAGAMATAMQATRIGLVIFAIPFLFAYNPIMLIVSEGGAQWDLGAFLFVAVKLAVIIYMLSSAASGYDRFRMNPLESVLRIAVGLAAIHPDVLWSGSAIGAAIAIFVGHRLLNSAGPTRAA